MSQTILNNTIMAMIGIVMTVFLGFALSLDAFAVAISCMAVVYITFSNGRNRRITPLKFSLHMISYLGVLFLFIAAQKTIDEIADSMYLVIMPIAATLLIIWLRKLLNMSSLDFGSHHIDPKEIAHQGERDARVVAVHESGHALAHAFARECVPHDFELNINALDDTYEGFVRSYTEDHTHYSAPFIRFHLMNLLAGRAAESVVFGTHTSGSQDDLNKWMKIATKYGESCLGLTLYSPPADANEAEANLSVLSQAQEKQYLEIWRFMEMNKGLLIEMSEAALAKKNLYFTDLMPFLDRAVLPDGSKILKRDAIETSGF